MSTDKKKGRYCLIMSVKISTSIYPRFCPSGLGIPVFPKNIETREQLLFRACVNDKARDLCSRVAVVIPPGFRFVQLWLGIWISCERCIVLQVLNTKNINN